MSVRVKALPRVQIANATLIALDNTVYTDSSIDQRTTTVDGYTFHWGINETRNFLDDGVGAAHAAFKTDGIIEDRQPSNNSRS